MLGVGLSFAAVHIVDLAFATVGLGLSELGVLSAFDWTLKVVEVVDGGDVRGTVPGVVAVLGLAKLMLHAATSNAGVTEVATFVTDLPH